MTLLPAGVWFKAQGIATAVALLAPGLNFKADKMDSLAHTLQKNHVEVYRMSLTGLNGDDQGDLASVGYETWAKDFQKAYAEVSGRAATLNVPTHFVGFSLGALVGLEELTREGSPVRFGRMALFAPALSLRHRSKLIHILKVFGKDFCLPSKNFPDYRVYPCTPMAAYGALFGGIKEFNDHPLASFSVANIPTLVFIDPNDELVSFKGVKKMVQNRGLSQWSFFEVNENETLLPRRIHHLIIDEPAVGPRQWEKITRSLDAHFSNGVESAPPR